MIVQLEECSYGPCTRAPLRKSFCDAHYQQSLKSKPLTSIKPKTRNTSRTDLSYNSAHMRTKKLRGSASSFKCVGCDSRAQDWSLNDLENPNHLEGPNPGTPGMLLRYSLDPMDYVPRCRKCHRNYDKGVRPNV